ncbi:GTP-binding protein [Desulfurococcus amylolyticus 1221n]|uniref:GTP-binding protein n=2 Tax=Desulfurococcus amylolyticus TaxID=94694 RepID=B8D373_DESA1|nr:GTP-binding protein [Desulfurococcus amylolyticus 1221n]
MEAKTPEEKMKALEDFLSSVPKHKGTEKLRLWATRRLAELREEIEEKKKRKTGRGVSFFIEKEGDVQVVVVGPPNTGKSMLVNRLTGARTIIADYPYSTTYPVPGMLKYRDIYIQLIDTPPLSRDSVFTNRVIGLARNADGLLIILDATMDPGAEFNEVKEILREYGIILSKPAGRVVIEVSRSGKHGLRFTLMGRLLNATLDDVRKLLEEYRIYNAHVKIYGEVTLDDVEQALFENTAYKPAIVYINKADLVKDIDTVIKAFTSSYNLPILYGSAMTGLGLDKIGEVLFDQLELIRVYTKSPNTPPSEKPLVLRKGATIRDVAESIHRDFVKNFLYAKIWGKSVKYPGEKVGLEHIVEDGDIVEIHIRG